MIMKQPIFADRRDAGRKLAAALREKEFKDPIVLALPRGGVPVAYEVARELNAPLDLLFVRKIGAPGHPEFGIGAIVDGENPQVVVNPEARQLAIPQSHYEAEARKELEEIERRRNVYAGGHRPLPVQGKTVIVVDDGIATGGTVRAALQALGEREAHKVVLAIPVGAADSIETLRSQTDEVVVLATPEPFYAVGRYYGDFTQTDDAEVVDLVRRAQTNSEPT